MSLRCEVAPPNNLVAAGRCTHHHASDEFTSVFQLGLQQRQHHPRSFTFCESRCRRHASATLPWRSGSWYLFHQSVVQRQCANYLALSWGCSCGSSGRLELSRVGCRCSPCHRWLHLQFLARHQSTSHSHDARQVNKNWSYYKSFNQTIFSSCAPSTTRI